MSTATVYHRVNRDSEEAAGDDVQNDTNNNAHLTLAAESPATPLVNNNLFALAIFSICTILLFSDQNLMAPNLTAIAAEFGFNDDQRDSKLGGEIALAFFLLGAPASFLVGCLGDRYNRTYLFTLTVFVGEGACFATFFCRTYNQLYACRAITGCSVGGALPLIYSILGDMFAADERHIVTASVGVGTGLGVAFGQAISGFFGPTLGWRAPFLMISIPALTCAVLVSLIVKDPERGGMEEAHREHREDQLNREQISSKEISKVELTLLKSEADKVSENNVVSTTLRENDEHWTDFRTHWKTFLSVLSTPTVVLFLFQGAPGCVPWGIVNTFLNDFLSQDRGMSVEYATFAIMIFGIGNFFGMVFSGAVGGYLYRKNRRYPLVLAGSAAIIGCIPFWILLNAIHASSPAPLLVIVAILSGLTTGITGPLIKATLQNVTLPNTRGQAFALYNTFDDFGRGLGPVFVSILIRRLGGRTQAFNVGVLGWIFCGCFNLLAYFTVEKDERYVQTTLAASLARLDQSQHHQSVVCDDEVPAADRNTGKSLSCEGLVQRRHSRGDSIESFKHVDTHPFC